MPQTVVNNRYTIVHTLGSGGMAKVYLAHDEVLDRDVALKVLREQFAEDEEFVERFKREAQSAAALSHPNIVQVYDRGQAEGGSYYIAMEYVPGGTLKELISSSGSLEPGAAAAFASQLAGALSAAHERGVVHRDIKPQNVLLTAAGDAKVADFGIATAASAATISQRSVVLGTASYMSPEQALGEPATPRSDLYSLGVVFYEMLTGELPYTAESPVAVSMKHVTEPPRHPGEVNPRIPEGLNTLVVKLLAKDPEARCADAGELVEDLRRARVGLPPIAAWNGTGTPQLATRKTAQTPRVVVSSWRGGWRRPWVLAALALLVTLGGLGWTLSQGRWEQGAATTENKVDQSPAGGQKVEEGSEVVQDVGDGPASADVPKVVGLGVIDAKARLGEAGLDVGSQRKVRGATAPEGVVVEQGYPAGTRVERGTAVNIGVSSGPQRIAAPGVAIQSTSAASARATATATALPAASAPALGEDAGEDIEGGNGGPGSDNSGPGGSGSSGD